VRLQGEFPRRCAASTQINVIERVTFADRLFRALWSRHGGTLLVAAELMGQTTVIQGIVDRHDGPARVTKHLGHTLFLESLYQKLRAVHVEILSFGRKKIPGP
jgi:hypothetical protein